MNAKNRLDYVDKMRGICNLDGCDSRTYLLYFMLGGCLYPSISCVRFSFDW